MTRREKILALCEFDTSKAHKHICELAKKGGTNWLMSIPPQPYDSDMLLQAPLDHIDKKILPIITALIERVEQFEDHLKKITYVDFTDDAHDIANKALSEPTSLDNLIQGDKSE